jgi:imidazolonepropionase-like amidohydrolase
MTKHIYITLIILAATVSKSFAQRKMHIVQGATIHTATGEVIDSGYLVFQDSKIVHVGKQLNAMYKNAHYVDAYGKHIYPGLICMNTILGLNELDAVRATRDYQEVGQFNPNVRSLIAFNTDSKLTPTARFNGILYVQSIPQGGTISGSSSVMRTTGWNWEDAVMQADDGIHLNWPEWWMAPDDEKQQSRIKQRVAEIEQFFSEAFAYSSLPQPEEINLRYEAMKRVFKGECNVYIHVQTARSMLQAIQFCKRYPQMKPVLMGAEEAYMIVEELKQANIPVVLDFVHRLPRAAHHAVDLPYRLPSLLHKAGITVAISHSGSWESRNLMFNAGSAAAYGLTKEEALQLITRNPARIIGNNQIGTLEKGKKASFIITSGDILDMKSSNVIEAFLDGEEIELTAEQQKLYEKYLKKYGLE